MSSNDTDRIKVLWIDDDPSETIDNAFYDAGIDTRTFRSARKALDEYIEHRGSYQAVILDLQDAEGTAIEFATAVMEFEPYLKKDFTPLYVLTNFHQNDQPYIEARATIISHKLEQDIFYHKSIHLDQLTRDIRNTVQNSDRFKAYQMYREVFRAFEENIFDVKYQDTVFKIIQGITGDDMDLSGLFNNMRQMFEMIFHKFIQHKMPKNYNYDLYWNIQEKRFKGKGRNKQAIIDFLGGKEIIVHNLEEDRAEKMKIAKKPMVSEIMSDVLQQLSVILNETSHYNPEKYPSDHKLYSILPNFARSNALLLLDLLGWASNEIHDTQRYEIESAPLTGDQEEKPGPETTSKKEYTLGPGEEKVEVFVASNERNVDRPIVRLADDPYTLISYFRSSNQEALKEWIRRNDQGNLTAIVKPAYEITRFEI